MTLAVMLSMTSAMATSFWAAVNPLSAHWGEREGPSARRWEGEVGMPRYLWNPPPRLASPPPGAERKSGREDGNSAPLFQPQDQIAAAIGAHNGARRHDGRRVGLQDDRRTGD